MDFYIDGEVKSELNNVEKRGKKLKNPNLNNSENPPVVFLSKEERENFKKEEEAKKVAERIKKEKEIENMKKLYLKSAKPAENKGKDRRRKPSPSRKIKQTKLPEKDKSHLREREIDEIKKYYLGLNKEKRKLVKPSEKFKNVFNFEWDASEDTSRDINPIYSQRAEPYLLFGRGIRGGVDLKEQQRKAKKYERMMEEILPETDSQPRTKDRSEKERRRSRSRRKEDRIEEEDYVPLNKKRLQDMNDRDWRIFREDHDILIKGGRVPNPLRSWDEKDLPEFMVDALYDLGFSRPTPIQMQAIPIGLEKRDLIGLAPTGSGKSAAFLIPLIAYLNTLPPIDATNVNEGPYAIILAPSRELAIQIHEEFSKFSKYTKLKAASVIGGRSTEGQAMQLGMGVEVIIATPGRLQDAIERKYTVLNQCHYIIMDEADKMIKGGFEDNLNFILDLIPESNLKSEDEKLAAEQERECKAGVRQIRITHMFSATMNPALEKLARRYLRCPAYISIGEPGVGKKEIEQIVEFVSDNEKKKKLRNWIQITKGPIMVFVNTKINAENLSRSLEKQNFQVASLHGGKKSQEAREKALNGFKSGKYDILVCTNVAARGIDIQGVSLVVNYDCPDDIEDYNHRIGRTGRAGSKGKAVTFLTNKDDKIFYDLKEYLEFNNQSVPKELAEHPASNIRQGVSKTDTKQRSNQIVYTN